MKVTEVPLCKCGCGKPVTMSKVHGREGQWNNFLKYHHLCKDKILANGYWLKRDVVRNKRRSDNYIPEHIYIVEKVLNKELPQEAEVHHFDGNRSNNQHSNLVVCQDGSYHQLLHTRQKAYQATGNAKALKCAFCGSYDNQEDMYKYPKENRSFATHKKCRLDYQRKWHKQRREEQL